MATSVKALVVAAAIISSTLGVLSFDNSAHAALAPRLGIHLLGDNGATYSQANAINNKGDIAGFSSSFNFPNFGATIWRSPQQPSALDLTSDGQTSAANDINQAGVAVGYKYGTPSGWHAMKWANGAAQELQPLTNQFVGFNYADEINDSGQAVGSSSFDLSGEHAVMWNSDNTVVDLSPNAQTGSAYGINNNGVITGQVNGLVQLWIDGTSTTVLVTRPTDIPANASAFYSGESVNITNDVAGYAAWSNDTSSGYKAFLWSSGATTILNPADPSYSECIAYGVNDAKEVVGDCINREAGGLTKAFYWHNGIMRILEGTPNGGSSHARAINNKGVVAGWLEYDGSNLAACYWK